MNFIKSIHPANLFRSKKHHLTKSAPASFNSDSTSSSSSSSSSHPANQTRRASADSFLELAEAFKLIDGKITAPPSEDEMKAMLAEIEINGDGEELREVFEVFDADCDGRISAEELLRVLSAIGDERCTLEDCRRMIEGVDVDGNGDGFVCFEDFERMMRCSLMKE